MIARPSAPAGVVRRARVILLSAGGASGIDIAVQLDLSPEAVSRIRRRFVETGVDGLRDQPKAGRRDHAVPAETVDQILQLALSPPPAGRSRWTTRLLARAVGRTRAVHSIETTGAIHVALSAAPGEPLADG